MSVFGPRLDRPSGVGDEGRPRETSLSIAALVVVGLTVVTFWYLDALGVTSTIGFAVGIFVAGMALLVRRRVRHQVVGHFLFHAGAILMVVAVIEGSARLGSSILLAGFVVTFFGLTTTWADVFTQDTLDEITNAAPISYIALLVSLFGFLVVAGAVLVVVGRLSALSAETEASASVSGFLTWVVIASFVVAGAIRLVPYHELLPRRNRSAWQHRLARISRRAAICGGLAIGALVLFSYVDWGSIDGFAAGNGVAGALLVGLSSPVIVGPLALVAAVVSLLAVVALGVNKAASMVADGNPGKLAGAIAGFLVAVFLSFLLLLSFGVGFGELLVIGIGGVVGLALIASIAVILVVVLASVAIEEGFVPDRAAGPATCAAGLLIAAVGAGLGGLPAPLVFGLVAGSILVWDLSTFGLGLTVELGHRPDTRRLELYHAVLSVGGGVGAVAGATGLLWVRRGVVSGGGSWPGVALAAFGATLLALAAAKRKA